MERSWPLFSIDNMLSLKSQDTDTGGKVEKKELDPDFKYEDELLEEQIAKNCARMFRELLDQLEKWNKLSLKEYNGILEIKFGKEIYANRDYYAYLVHLAGKRLYDVGKLLKKQDTLLEEMVAEYLPPEDKERFVDLKFEITFGNEDVELYPRGADSSDTSFMVRDMRFEKVGKES